MSVHVFVSSTSADLQEDCRRYAMRAIQRFGAAAVAMETWVTEYLPVVDAVRQKVEGSTHYLGIIAYRRGFQPDGLPVSITEAEFDWAAQKVRAVMIPSSTTPFGAELRKRAAAQSEAAAEAQRAFLARVMGSGACTPFDDPADLEVKVTFIVERWVNGPLRHLASAAAAPESAPAGPRRIEDLGRAQHVYRFIAALDAIEGQGLRRIAAFALHGQGGSGHDALAQRLRGRVADTSRSAVPPLHCTVDVGVSWRQNGLEKVVDVLGAAVEPGAADDLAARLGRALRRRDVVLDVGSLQRFEGGLPGFLDRFWQPLVASLTARSPHRLIALLRIERVLPSDWATRLGGDALAFQAHVPLRLPDLVPFTQEEIADWLIANVSDERALEIAEAIHAETGGHAQSVYAKLQDPSTWT